MRSCYIFDIDGTIANNQHRLHFINKLPKDWEGFYAAIPDDEPIDHIIRLIAALQYACVEIVYVTGRPERTRADTIAWLKKWSHYEDEPIYMRGDNDRLDDHRVKMYLLHALRDDGWLPEIVFDDRDRVVEMWREQDIPCLQVANGSF